MRSIFFLVCITLFSSCSLGEGYFDRDVDKIEICISKLKGVSSALIDGGKLIKEYRKIKVTSFSYFHYSEISFLYDVGVGYGGGEVHEFPQASCWVEDESMAVLFLDAPKKVGRFSKKIYVDWNKSEIEKILERKSRAKKIIGSELAIDRTYIISEDGGVSYLGGVKIQKVID